MTPKSQPITADVVAIIPAAGSGARLPGPVSKQYRSIGGISILARTIDALGSAPSVGAIIVAAAKDEIEVAEAEAARSPVPVRVVCGGASRFESVGLALDVVGEGTKIVVVHDGVRPFVSEREIEETVAEARRSGAAIAASEPVETVKEAIAGKGVIRHSLDRRLIRLAQTPQAFQVRILKAAYRNARESGFSGTDEASLVERIGETVTFVDADRNNRKITTDADLQFAEWFMAKDKVRGGEFPRSGIGYDSHRFVEGRPLILGGVEIPHTMGLDGHSDADALLHAIIDAILGAASAGDIGSHFPDTDPRWKGAPSVELLGGALEVVRSQGWRVGNVDAVIIAEAPKIAPHVPAMKERIAELLHIDCQSVSVKGKTSERMGPIGRGEGVEVHVVAMLIPC